MLTKFVLITVIVGNSGHITEKAVDTGVFDTAVQCNQVGWDMQKEYLRMFNALPAQFTWRCEPMKMD